MKTSDIATELDRAFAAARVNALMGGVVMGDTVDPLHVIHKALKAKYAAGEDRRAIHKEVPRAFGNARQCCRVTLHPTEHERAQ